jgi:hypothetical protein
MGLGGGEVAMPTVMNGQQNDKAITQAKQTAITVASPSTYIVERPKKTAGVRPMLRSKR